MLSLVKQQGMSASDNWGPTWSEEPPYFDEDDSQDDEGNWGRAKSDGGGGMGGGSGGGGIDKPGYGAVSGSSDLWTRQTPADLSLKFFTGGFPTTASVTTTNNNNDAAAVANSNNFHNHGKNNMKSDFPSPAPTITPAQNAVGTTTQLVSETQQLQSHSQSLTIVLEMNRQFASLDTKMMDGQNRSDRKVDSLMKEIRWLNRWLGLAVGGLIVVLLKTIVT